MGLRPFGLGSATIRDDQDLNTENNNVNTEEENVERDIEESKRFFSRFPPVAHHNMVQYSHLGKIRLNVFFPHVQTDLQKTIKIKEKQF